MKTSHLTTAVLCLTLALYGCGEDSNSNNGDNNNNTGHCDSSIDTSTVQFVSATATVDEVGGSVQVNVTRQGGCTGELIVSYTVDGGTASAGADYIEMDGQLSWQDQETTDKSISITVVNDDEVEGDETVQITLSIFSGDAKVGAPATAIVTIFDDELSGPQPFLVADIRTVGNNGIDPYQRGVIAGDLLYFTADDGLSGVELWRTDGTISGTVQVADIAPGPGSSDPKHLVAVGSTLFFKSFDTETRSSHLYKVGPGIDGVVRVSPEPIGVYQLTAVGDRLFIVTGGDELWVSDGTAGGTIRLRTFLETPTELTALGATLYFAAIDHSNNGVELWSSDGTPDGTAQVLDLAPGSASSSPQNLVVVGDQLFFDADDGSGSGREPYTSDGTGVGTSLIGDISPGAASTALSNNLAIGDTLYFAHETSAEGVELWKSDGTADGTILVKDITPNSADSYPSQLTAVGTTLYFVTQGSGGVALWKSDGTQAGTVQVKVLYSGTWQSAYMPEHLTAVGNTLFFQAYTGLNDRELWKSDGTELGTVVVKERTGGIAPNPHRLYPLGLIAFADILFFFGDDGIHGFELWTSDGTEEGTNMVVDINQVPLGSMPGGFIAIDSTLYFGADDGVAGYEVWRSDGTTAGTSLLADIGGGGRLTAVGSELFIFGSDNPSPGSHLWTSDGTTEGTEWVSAIAQPHGLTAATDSLLFFSGRGGSGVELWKSDGTEAGTAIVRDIEPTGSSNPGWLTGMGSTLFFTASTEAAGRELWMTDGTEGGTVMVKDIVPGQEGSTPTDFTPRGSTLYFVATDESGVTGIWQSDGTDAGTTVTKAVWSSSSLNTPSDLTWVDAILYFLANDLTGGIGLWKSDGTNAGTVLVRSLPIYDPPAFLTAVGSRLFFVAGNDEQNANALWMSDGTESGTNMLKDMVPEYSRQVRPKHLTAVGDILVFSVDDGVTGEELWRSDGTELGTHRVADLNPGSANSSPSFLIEMNGTVYFRATNTEVGDELWGYTP